MKANEIGKALKDEAERVAHGTVGAISEAMYLTLGAKSLALPSAGDRHSAIRLDAHSMSG